MKAYFLDWVNETFLYELASWYLYMGVGVLVCWWLLTSPLMASRIYTYVNENGVRVYTNIPRALDHPTVTRTATTPARARKHTFGPLIEEISHRHGVDAKLVEAVMSVESSFNPRAVSLENCKGLMQLHTATAQRFGVKDVFDPAQNIEGGVRYLKYLTGYFQGDLEKVLAAYNAGEQPVIRYQGVPPYRETRAFIKKVKRALGSGDLSQSTASSPASTGKLRPEQRVQRVVLTDGKIVFTNTSLLVESN